MIKCPKNNCDGELEKIDKVGVAQCKKCQAEWTYLALKQEQEKNDQNSKGGKGN